MGRWRCVRRGQQEHSLKPRLDSTNTKNWAQNLTGGSWPGGTRAVVNGWTAETRGMCAISQAIHVRPVDLK